ncbi:hypothetical protein Nepgr_001962 [Nepenthes gracilis]|uniref:phosphoglycerate mutase (2,3-diphosphoglycerate-dependent) n=1 Tax=Nepenthes gracilis TaxID=150966 RepID=A0AAD3RY02_NEPGR|nr:hypothetical protein Nepgr_001962 [Nepenthes gracilis]
MTDGAAPSFQNLERGRRKGSPIASQDNEICYRPILGLVTPSFPVIYFSHFFLSNWTHDSSELFFLRHLSLPPSLCVNYLQFRFASRSSNSNRLIKLCLVGIQNGRFSIPPSGNKFSLELLKIESHSSGKRSSSLIQAYTSHISVSDPVSSPSNNSTSDTRKKSNEVALILVRHGESLWNEKNLFTGCVDVPLTKKGVEEAIEAGKRISSIPVDMIFTSGLIRAQMTAMLAMTQHRRRKVPIIMHNESEQAKAWSEIYSEDTREQSIPVIAAWQLNERMYGELQGLNKQETAERFGKEKVHEWRRSYDIPPPNGESLAMCAKRAVAYFKEHIEPQLLSGKNVMISAHGNSLRSIIMYLDKLTSQEVISLELSTGIPLLYIFKEGKFIRRGSPVGPTEAGVYAYTRSLALYRQKLDEMFR